MPVDTRSDSTAKIDQTAEEYARLRADADSATARRLQADVTTRLLPLADRLARRYRASDQSSDDLLQVARLGLVKAVSRYDPGRGSFTAYAVTVIDGELKRYFRDHTWSVRVPRRVQEHALETRKAETALAGELRRSPTDAEIAAHCRLSVPDVAEARLSSGGYRSLSLNATVGENGRELGDEFGAPDPGIDLVGDRLTVADLVRRLPERERRLLTLRFANELTQTEIAREFGLSQMHVSRLLSRVLTWLREAMLTDSVPRWPGTELDEPDDEPRVSVRATAKAVHVGVAGEIDRDNAAAVRRRLLDALATEARTATVDLRRVPLIDAAGAAVLRSAHEVARARGIDLRLVGLQPFVQRTLAACGLRALLPRPYRKVAPAAPVR